jgi:hypothetical protein
MNGHVRRWCGALLAAALVLFTPTLIAQQQSKSAALAAELVKLLDARKLDSIGAKIAEPDRFAGALYFPGSQLLVIQARYLVPPRMELYIQEKNYRDVYLDLNSASVPETKIFISDLGANGLQFQRRNNNDPFDTVDREGKSFSFNGDWGRQRLSRDEYTKAYEATDGDYVKMLEALIAEAKKGA